MDLVDWKVDTVSEEQVVMWGRSMPNCQVFLFLFVQQYFSNFFFFFPLEKVNVEYA